MRDNKELTKYVSAFLLGDSSITIDKRDWGKGGNATFECCQIIDHLDYLEWMKSILEDVTTIKLELKPTRKEYSYQTFPNGVTSRVKPQYRLRSARHPFFNSFRERMYGTGKKTPDYHYLKLLDWESIAIWYMDDGYISSSIKENHSGKHYYQDLLGLCTHGFSYGDNLLLKEYLRDNFQVEFNVQAVKQNGNLHWKLALRSKDIKKFVDGVSPYILPSFEYKLKITRTGSSIESTMDEDIV